MHTFSERLTLMLNATVTLTWPPLSHVPERSSMDLIIVMYYTGGVR